MAALARRTHRATLTHAVILAGIGSLGAGCSTILGIEDLGSAPSGADAAAASPDARSSADAGLDALIPSDASPCIAAPTLNATMRDLQFSHPDFENFTGTGVFPGIVQDQLGSDDTPTYQPSGATAVTTGPTEFLDWYHDNAAVNLTLTRTFPLTLSNGHLVYDDQTFFPLDGDGFGNEGIGQDGMPHNFSFTTEIHAAFLYRGGETVSFFGDDDVWIFINRRLAIDLGGVHGPEIKTLKLDDSATALGLTPGQEYPIDLFHAERRTVGSTFRIDTTIGCFVPR